MRRQWAKARHALRHHSPHSRPIVVVECDVVLATNPGQYRDDVVCHGTPGQAFGQLGAQEVGTLGLGFIVAQPHAPGHGLEAPAQGMTGQAGRLPGGGRVGRADLHEFRELGRCLGEDVTPPRAGC